MPSGRERSEEPTTERGVTVRLVPDEAVTAPATEAVALVAKWRLTTGALSQLGLPLAAESVPELAEDLGRVLELLIGPDTAIASRQAPC